MPAASTSLPSETSAAARAARGSAARALGRAGTAAVMRAAVALTEALLPRTPTPHDSPQARAMGPHTLRVLLVGSGPAVGRGVSSHELALPGAFARTLASTAGRGVIVDVVSDGDMTVLTVPAAIRHLHLDRYDAVILTLGTNEALRLMPPFRWATALAGLLAGLESAMKPGGRVYFTALRPMRTVAQFDSIIGTIADRHAHCLNAIARTLCDGWPGRFSLPPLSAPAEPCGTTDRYRTADQYAVWARELVTQTQSTLTDLEHPASAQEDELAAVDSSVAALDWEVASHDPVLHRLTDLAHQKLGGQTAVITLLDREGQHHLAVSGRDVPEIAGPMSFSATAVRDSGPLLIPDAPKDDRFWNHPMVAGEPRIRFYLGCPIRTVTGEPIGALSVLDPEPRAQMGSEEVSYLQGLAILAGDRLQLHLPATPQ